MWVQSLRLVNESPPKFLNKAKWTGFQSYVAEKKTEILNNLYQQDVEII